MDEKTIQDAVEKGFQRAEERKKTGLSDAELAEQALLKSLDGVDPRIWQEQLDAVPTFN